jgi:hypothetical protein
MMEDKGGEGRDGREGQGKGDRKREKGKEKGGGRRVSPQTQNLTPPMWWTIYKGVFNSYFMV